jgi:hypothetical protein
MSQYDAFHHNSHHGEGVFVWEGIIFHWYVGKFAGDLTLTLARGDGHELR